MECAESGSSLKILVVQPNSHPTSTTGKRQLRGTSGQQVRSRSCRMRCRSHPDAIAAGKRASTLRHALVDALLPLPPHRASRLAVCSEICGLRASPSCRPGASCTTAATPGRLLESPCSHLSFVSRVTACSSSTSNGQPGLLTLLTSPLPRRLPLEQASSDRRLAELTSVAASCNIAGVGRTESASNIAGGGAFDCCLRVPVRCVVCRSNI